MKKGIKIVSIVVLTILALLGINTNTIKVESKKYMEGNINSPVCRIAISRTIGIFRTKTGVITCYDEDGLNDSNIQTSDIVVSGGIIKKSKILKVYNKSTSDGKTYTWKFDYKGIFFGRADFYIENGSVSDTYGSLNWPSTTKSTFVTLF